MTPTPAHTRICTLAEEEMRRFTSGVTKVREAQERVLADILRTNQDTLYGREFDFAGIDSAEEFRARVPLVDYEQIAERIELIMQGRADILFPGKPVCLQPTSGTTSDGKNIPFTSMLQKQFRAAVLPWFSDLYKHEPSLADGPWYWSLSPLAMQETVTRAGVTIGFPDDPAYLGDDIGDLLRGCFAVPSEVVQVDDPVTARKLSLAFLLQSESLALVSVWNPSFFSLLLSSWDDNQTEIAEALSSGVLPCKAELPDALYTNLQAVFGRVSVGRAGAVTNLLGEGEILDCLSAVSGQLWPKLKVLSCWVDADAKAAALRLGSRFPKARIQPKGLIATEGVVTIPLMAADYPVLAVHSHFYEFSPLDQPQVTLTADQLAEGAMYRVVLTTGGGLYRYRLGDVVKVRGLFGEAPMLEFMGRGHGVSDHYGEKLHQLHVAGALLELLCDLEEGSCFTLLAPDGEDCIRRYCLFLATDSPLVSDTWLAEREATLDLKLRENFHFDYCRRIGQLEPTRIVLLDVDPDSAETIFITEMTHRGLKEGDVKPSVLDARPVWRTLFGGCRD